MFLLVLVLVLVKVFRGVLSFLVCKCARVVHIQNFKHLDMM